MRLWWGGRRITSIRQLWTWNDRSSNPKPRVQDGYCNCSDQMLRHSLAALLVYMCWRHNVIDISLLFLCLRYWIHISYRKQGALFTEIDRVDWLLSASSTRSKFLWKMLLLKRTTCCLALRSFSNVSHTDVLGNEYWGSAIRTNWKHGYGVQTFRHI